MAGDVLYYSRPLVNYDLLCRLKWRRLWKRVTNHHGDPLNQQVNGFQRGARPGNYDLRRSG